MASTSRGDLPLIQENWCFAFVTNNPQFLLFVFFLYPIACILLLVLLLLLHPSNQRLFYHLPPHTSTLVRQDFRLRGYSTISTFSPFLTYSTLWKYDAYASLPPSIPT